MDVTVLLITATESCLVMSESKWLSSASGSANSCHGVWESLCWSLQKAAEGIRGNGMDSGGTNIQKLFVLPYIGGAQGIAIALLESLTANPSLYGFACTSVTDTNLQWMILGLINC